MPFRPPQHSSDVYIINGGTVRALHWLLSLEIALNEADYIKICDQIQENLRIAMVPLERIKGKPNESDYFTPLRS